MEASELIPTLRPLLHPGARILLMDAPAEERSGLKWGKTVRPLNRLGEIARECGFVVEESAQYMTIAGEVPEVIVFDGAAVLASAKESKAAHNGNSTPFNNVDLGTMRELHAMPLLNDVTFVATISERMTSDETAQLEGSGVSAFLSAEASAVEAASCLQSATKLSRARTEIADLRAQIARSLRVDDITGVMTRRFFFQQAYRECARARRYGHPLSCLMVEVDHYRMLCARFTDSTGESVLRSVATLIGQWTRDSDIIARFAESKFIVLLPETDIAGATAAREKVLAALANTPWNKGEQTLPVSVSVGEAQLEHIAPTRQNDDESSESDDMGETALSTREAMAGLLEDADSALFIARKGARVPDILVPQMIIENKTPPLSSAA